MYTSFVLYSTIFALSMERTWLTFHCWLYNLCIVVYVTNKTWNLKIKQKHTTKQQYDTRTQNKKYTTKNTIEHKTKHETTK